MQNQQNSFSVRSLIPRGTQIGFVVGLFVGILLGWMFSGVVGAVLQFGFVAVALLILLAALFFWWNVRRAPKREAPTVYTWTSSSLPQQQDDLFGQGGRPQAERRDQDVIDLEELKREMNRERES